MITGAQMRAARGLLRWFASALAKKADVSLPTIQRMEKVDGVPSAYATNLDAVQKALELAGVEFIPENGSGAGVCFREPLRKRPQET